jgi:hypothetical protein
MTDKRIRKIHELLADLSASYAPSDVAEGVWEVRLAMRKLECLVEVERLKRGLPWWMRLTAFAGEGK